MWNHRHVPPLLVYRALGTKPGIGHIHTKQTLHPLSYIPNSKESRLLNQISHYTFLEGRSGGDSKQQSVGGRMESHNTMGLWCGLLSPCLAHLDHGCVDLSFCTGYGLLQTGMERLVPCKGQHGSPLPCWGQQCLALLTWTMAS